jgi:hypothetical protein
MAEKFSQRLHPRFLNKNNVKTFPCKSYLLSEADHLEVFASHWSSVSHDFGKISARLTPNECAI